MTQERPGVVTTAAVLCLIFGLCCAGVGGLFTAAPIFLKEMAHKISSKVHTEIPARREALRRERAATNDPNRIRAIDNQLQALESFEKNDPDKMLSAILPESVMNCIVFEGLMGLGLNLALFIAGCGMFSPNAWARTVCLWASALRIASAVVSMILALTVINPAVSEGLQKLQDMTGQSGNQFNQSAGNMLTQTIANLVFACILPTVLIVLLNTSAARQWFAQDSDGARSDGFQVEGGDGPRITMVPR
jgi:hypothetical protein